MCLVLFRSSIYFKLWGCLSLHMTAHDNKHEQGGFYKLALQTARRKADLPKDQFQVLLLRLLGNKDHEKVFDIVCKLRNVLRKITLEWILLLLMSVSLIVRRSAAFIVRSLGISKFIASWRKSMKSNRMLGRNKILEWIWTCDCRLKLLLNVNINLICYWMCGIWINLC